MIRLPAPCRSRFGLWLGASVAVLTTPALAQYVPPGYPQNYGGYPPAQQQGVQPSPYAAAAYGAAAYGQPGYGQPGYGAPMYGAPPQAALLSAPGQLPGQSQAQFGQGLGGAGGMAAAGVIPVDPPGGLGGYNAPGGSTGGIRADLLVRSARSIGFQAGFEAEVARLNSSVEREASAALDRDFNFRALLVDGVVVPPVITEVREAGEQKSGKTIALALGMFRIVSPARLSLKPPSWRDYVYISESFGRSRGPEFRPRTDEERRLYDAAVEEARNDGIEHARELFRVNMARLVRDYDGMKLYHELAQSGAVSLPKVSRSTQALALTEGRNRATVGGMTVELVVTPNFKPASAQAYMGNRSAAAAPPQTAPSAVASISPPPPVPAVEAAPLPPPPPPAKAPSAASVPDKPAGAPLDIRPPAPSPSRAPKRPVAPAVAAATPTPPSVAASVPSVPQETQVVSLDPVQVKMGPPPVAAPSLFNWLGPRPQAEPVEEPSEPVAAPVPPPAPTSSSKAQPAAGTAKPVARRTPAKSATPAPSTATAPAAKLPPLPAATYEAAAAYEAGRNPQPQPAPVRPSATPAEAAAFIGRLSGGGR